MRAGGIDLGVVEVLREPVPESFDAVVLQRGARESRAPYKAMFRDVNAAIMMPGANTSHPAYLAMQGAFTLAAVAGQTSLDAYMAGRYLAGPAAQATRQIR